MEVELLSILAKLGIGAVGLYLMFRLFMRTLNLHSEERKAEGAMWREEIKEGRNSTERVIKELTQVINETRRH